MIPPTGINIGIFSKLLFTPIPVTVSSILRLPDSVCWIPSHGIPRSLQWFSLARGTAGDGTIRPRHGPAAMRLVVRHLEFSAALSVPSNEDDIIKTIN